MLRTAVATLLAATIAVPAAAFACDGEKAQSTSSKIKTATLAEAAAWNNDHKAQFVDVNGSDFRTKNGVIPGAILLTSSAKYDVEKELPSSKDSKLVFYCASTQCGASKQAAKRAVEAGYSDVNVLPDGLMGWKKSGNKTEMPNS